MHAAPVPNLAGNLAAIGADIASACVRAGRDPTGVRLIAVTKEQDPEVLPALRALGVRDIGENRLEHLAAMHAAAPAGTAIHAIGRVQGRQLAKLAPLCAALHSLCEEDHIRRLGHACDQLGRRLPVFLQVNVSGDPDKSGMTPTDLPARLELARSQRQLDVVGLMTMAPLRPDGSDAARRSFAVLRELAFAHGLARLSMGMSEDFVIAVEEGATDVRIGTRLFA